MPPQPRPKGSYPSEALSPAALVEVNLPSKARAKETGYLICLPGPDNEPRPTVILLHGPGESYTVWRDRLGDGLLDMARDLAVNLIMPDGDPYGWYLDSPFKRDSRLETYIMGELLPDTAGRFLLDPARVGVLGVSMGGHGALTLAMKHPGRFRSVGAISGITVLEGHSREAGDPVELNVEGVLGPYPDQGALWRGNGAYHMARRLAGALDGVSVSLAVGLSDPMALAENRQFHRLLSEMGVAHGYGEINGGGHGWDLWGAEVPRQLSAVAGAL
jgi:S-formylglutathione hydrolase FrmB